MRCRAAPRPNRKNDRTDRPVRRAHPVRTTLASLLAGCMVGMGVLVLEGSELVEGAATAIVPESSQIDTAQSETAPQSIPVVETLEAVEGPDGHIEVERPQPEQAEAPVVVTEATEEELEAPAAKQLPEATVVPPEQVPTGNPITLASGGDTRTVATVSGTGTIRLGFTRTESSAAPNLPTYVSAICDGESVYSGAFNTTTAGPVVQDVPFSGSSCVVKVKVAQPSPRWAGTSSAVVVTRDAAAETQQGSPYVEDATWTTTAVTGSDAFEIAVPEGFTGTVSVKLTACSSEGGTSDATRDFACGEHVEKGVGSEGTITVSDGEQLLASTSFDISAETHHDMVTLDIEEPAADDLVVGVERTDGSAVLVHGPGTGAVGTH